MTTLPSNRSTARPRSAAPAPSQGRGLLIRRPSTPNTLKSLVNLFSNAAPQPAAKAIFDSAHTGSRTGDTPAFSDCAPHAETIAYMRMLVSAVPGSHATLRHQSPMVESNTSQDPTKQSTLPGASLHSAVLGTGDPSGNRSPSASTAATPAVPTLAPPAALWEPALVKPHQVRLHHGRPLSATSCERLRPSSALRRPMSSKPALVSGGLGSRRDASVNVCQNGDVLTGCALVRSPAHRALLDSGCRKAECFPEITTALSRLLASVVHQDAATTHASQQSTRSKGIFPLPSTSPWSMIGISFSIVRERFLFHVRAPASKIVGCRVFWSMLSVLNGLATCPAPTIVTSLAHYFEGATTVVDGMEGVPLQEADRHDDESDEEIVVVVSRAESVQKSEDSVPNAAELEEEDEVAAELATTEATAADEASMCAVEPQASPVSPLLSTSAILVEADTSVAPDVASVLHPEESVAKFSPSRCLASFRQVALSKPDASGRRELSPPREPLGSREPLAATQPQALGRRISIFLDHSLVGQAASALRKVSSGSHIPENRSANCNGPHSPLSEDRSRPFSDSTASSCASWSPSRSARSVAVIIAVSTFRSVDIPPCMQILSDANDMAAHLRDECGFDEVILMSSESPSNDCLTPTMANIRRVNEAILNKYVADTDNAEPLVTYIVLSRGGICLPGSISGVSSKSCGLVPFPSASYQGVVAKEPTQGIKVSLLEGAEPTALRSLDIVTPEMFYDMLRFNGRIVQPLVIFDVWPCRLGQPYSRPGSAMCGFASWTVPDCAEANFVSVSRTGVGGVLSYYFRKLLIGGVTRSLAKRFRRSDGFAKARYGALLARAAGSNYSVSVLQAFHYLVSRLLKRSNSVHYNASSLLEEMATYASNEALERGPAGESILGGTFRSKPRSRFLFRQNRFSSEAATVSANHVVDAVDHVVEYAIGRHVGSCGPSRVMYDCDVEVGMTFSGRMVLRQRIDSAWLNDALLRWKGRMSTSLRSLFLRRKAPMQQVDDECGSSPRGPPRVWSCSFAELEAWVLRCRPEVAATDTAHVLCQRFLDDLLRPNDFVTIEVSEHESTVTLKMLQRNDELRQCLMERIWQLAGKGANHLGTDPNRSSWGSAAQTLADSVARISTHIRFSLALSKWEAQKVDLAGRMQGFKSVGAVLRLCPAHDAGSLVDRRMVSEGEYAAAFRIQTMWARVIPLRTLFKRIRRVVSEEEPALRVMVAEEEHATRSTELRDSLLTTLLEGIAAWEQRCRHNVEGDAAIGCTLGVMGDLAALGYQLEESHHRCALAFHEAVTAECNCFEPHMRRWIEFEWASPWVPTWQLARGAAPVHKFYLLYWIATKEAHDRMELRRAEIRGRIVIWDLTGDFLKDVGIQFEDFVEPVPENPFVIN